LRLHQEGKITKENEIKKELKKQPIEINAKASSPPSSKMPLSIILSYF